MNASAARRLRLVPTGARRSSSPAASREAALRRYRFARVRVEEPGPRRRDPARFSHLKRAYD